MGADQEIAGVELIRRNLFRFFITQLGLHQQTSNEIFLQSEQILFQDTDDENIVSYTLTFIVTFVRFSVICALLLFLFLTVLLMMILARLFANVESVEFYIGKNTYTASKIIKIEQHRIRKCGYYFY